MVMPVGLCGRVMLDVLRARRDQRHELVGVDAKALLEGEVEVADVGLDGPRRLDVGGVVRADDDEVVALVEQRRGDDEERLGGARRDEHVVTAHAAARPSALRGDQLAKRVVAEVIAVEEDHVADLDAEVGQRAIANGALGEIEADLVVAQLFGRLLLDGHAAVLHER